MAKQAPNALRRSVPGDTAFVFPNPDIPLTKLIDIDDGVREVPVNMNFIADGYLTKDTGMESFANTGASLIKRLFNYKKKDGTQYFIRQLGTRLEKYNSVTGVFDVIGSEASISGTVTVTASNTTIVGSLTSFLSTLTVGDTVRIGAQQFTVASISDNTHFVVNESPQTSSSGSTVYKLTVYVWTADKKIGFKVYNNILYGGNGVDDFFSYDGTTLTKFPSVPKGNIIEVFEDRMFISGSTAEPLTIYYSDTGAVTTFQPTSTLTPLGTDVVTGLLNYYGILIIFKKTTTTRMSFIYDSVAAAYIPKLETLNGNYGCVGPWAYTWVENDVWFFTGKEVRALGFKDQQTGILGVNDSVISNDIKENLGRVTQSNAVDSISFYYNRRYYLAIPFDNTYLDTIYVCHLLYSNKWTKYKNRTKASVSDFVIKDDIIYSASGNVNGKIYKWSGNFNDDGAAINGYVNFADITQKDFSLTVIYRYLDLYFQNQMGECDITIWGDDFGQRTSKATTFTVNTYTEGDDNPLGEIDFGELWIGDAFGTGNQGSTFINKRVSFLSKAQTIKLGLANNNLDETFTVGKFIFQGSRKPRRYFSPGKITSIG